MSQSAAHDEHSSFIQTPQQLLVVLLLSFLIPIFGIVMLVHLVLGETPPNPAALEPAAVAARILPVGKVEVVDANAPATRRAQRAHPRRAIRRAGARGWDRASTA